LVRWSEWASSTLAFEQGVQCVRLARNAVADACRGLARDVSEIAQLLTSELVTNAVQHGSGTIAIDQRGRPIACGSPAATRAFSRRDRRT
jgi:anti-sigma regulatory factor (Ser/Thr protein kinase)